ncbi:MAG: hypothetical protein R2877_00685 [Bdellovibrionota bacterium]
MAVLILIFATYFPIQWFLASEFKGMGTHDHPIIWSYKLFAITTLSTLVVIVGSCLYKIYELSEGGHSIAHMMNGRLIDYPTHDFKEKQLLNVVEEMALPPAFHRPMSIFWIRSIQSMPLPQVTQ